MQSPADKSRCETCKFWKRWPLFVDSPAKWGYCQCHAPGKYVREHTPEPQPHGEGFFVVGPAKIVEHSFPPMRAGDWCGDYETIVE